VLFCNSTACLSSIFTQFLSQLMSSFFIAVNSSTKRMEINIKNEKRNHIWNASAPTSSWCMLPWWADSGGPRGTVAIVIAVSELNSSRDVVPRDIGLGSAAAATATETEQRLREATTNNSNTTENMTRPCDPALPNHVQLDEYYDFFDQYFNYCHSCNNIHHYLSSHLSCSQLRVLAWTLTASWH